MEAGKPISWPRISVAISVPIHCLHDGGALHVCNFGGAIRQISSDQRSEGRDGSFPPPSSLRLSVTSLLDDPTNAYSEGAYSFSVWH